MTATRIKCWIARTCHERNSYYFTQYDQEFKLTLNSFTFSMVMRRLDVWLESICSQLLISFRHGWRGMISSVYLEEIIILSAVGSWSGRPAYETKFLQTLHKKVHSWKLLCTLTWLNKFRYCCSRLWHHIFQPSSHAVHKIN